MKPQREGRLEETRGLVMNIQHYCVHDGPGIRTGVFLQGCPLRCAWCANPESQSAAPTLLFHRELCTACGRCMEACTHSAIRREEDNALRFLRDQCVSCGACAAMCPTGARRLSSREMTAGEVLHEVERDRLFYGADGGVTLTGGEATAQPAFSTALLRLCRERGLGTALETCGAVNWEVLGRLAGLTDTILYDVKCMDNEKHRRLTGIGNRMILHNLEALSAERESRLIVRMPVIPGYNDTEDELHTVGAYLQGHVPRCQEVHLLPYHDLGEDKYVQMGVVGRDFSSQIPEPAHMEHLRGILRQYVAKVK